MQLDYLQHFNDTNDLIRQLCWADFDSVSAAMQASTKNLMAEAVNFWQQHFFSVF